MSPKTTAIQPDKIDETPLGQLSAAEFLGALKHRQAVPLMHHWPEKKKYELEVDPTIVGKLKFREFVDILEHIKGEKKKAELEIPDWLRARINPEPTPWRVNPEPDPWRGDPSPQPAIRALEARLDRLAEGLNAIAEKVNALGK